MKQKVAKFILYVYLTYIKEEWEILTSIGQKVLYPFWFIRSFLIWLICPIFIPEYLFKQSKIYKKFKAAERKALKL